MTLETSTEAEWFLDSAESSAPPTLPATPGVGYLPYTYDWQSNPDLYGLFSRSYWTFSGSQTLSYSFPTSASQYGANYGNGEANYFVALTTGQQNVIRAALGAYSAVSGLSFVEATGSDASQATMRFARVSYTTQTAWGYYPSPNPAGGDAWFSNVGGNTPVLGSYYYHQFLHEIGHTLGLKHSQEPSSNNPVTVSAAHDSMEYTVMSYRSYANGPLDGYTNGQYDYAQSLMMLDIQAIQFLYGANFTTNADNTTYTFDPNTGEMFINGQSQGKPGANRIFRTVWDGGGTDTYDLSNYSTNLSIDLTPGGHSVFSQAQLALLNSYYVNINGAAPIYAAGNLYNALQYNGDIRSLIENAIGGSGNDTILGNQADNSLVGNAGNDSLSGGDGNDTLSGGAGNDSLLGGPGRDSLDGGDGNDSFYITSQNGTVDGGLGSTDQLYLSYSFSFYTVTITGHGIDLKYGALNDIYVYGVEFFTFNYGGGSLQNYTLNQLLSGATTSGPTNGDDSLVGTSGNDSLNGLGGNDTLSGGAGYDTLDGGDGYDIAVFANYFSSYSWDWSLTGNGTTFFTLTDRTTNDVTLLYNIESLQFADQTFALILGTAASEILYGTSGNDIIIGANGNDTLLAGSGDDQLRGGGGDDSLSGGAGDDRLKGNAGNDTLDGGDGNDVLDGGDGTDVAVLADPFSVYNWSLITASDGSGYMTVTDMVTNYTTTLYNIEYLKFSDQTIGLRLGTGGDDSLVGTSAKDILYGADGQDTLDGKAGDDSLFGGNGNDSLSGGAGNDVLKGSGGNDTIDGGDGEDQVRYDGALGAVTVDLARGIATGAYGNDVLINIEDVRGTDFGDSLLGDGNTNFLYGGKGNDTIDGGDGRDWSSYRYASGAVVADLAGTGAGYGTSSGSDGRDILINIERLEGSSYNDSLYGNDGQNRLRGRGGDDYLDGRGGEDMADYHSAGGSVIVDLSQGKAWGADGNDTLVNIEDIRGSYYSDSLKGDAGNNVLRDAHGNDTLDGGDGIDTADFSDSTTGVTATLSQDGVTPGTATSDGFNAQLINIENLTGGDFNDYLVGNADNNSINGGAGDDTIVASAGNDTIDGGGGYNVVVFAKNASAYLNFVQEDENGVAYLTVTDLATGNLTEVHNCQEVRYADQTYFLELGDSGNNLLSGGSGNDLMYGASGNDTLLGGAGDDIIIGGEGDNSLSGGSGDDFLVGNNYNEGNDTLDGGDGTDTAVFDYNRSDYFVTVLPNGALQVARYNNGQNVGTDILINIERLHFADGDFNVSDFLNKAPTAVTLTNTLNSLPENSDTSLPIKVADITITDDGLGTNTLALVGADAALFEIITINGVSALYLRAGVALDYETRSHFDVTVEAYDATVAGSRPVSQDFSLAILHVDKAPNGVTLTNASVAENSAAGTVVGQAVGIDPDRGDTLYYALVNAQGLPYNGPFVIDRITGVITVASGAVLDYERLKAEPVSVKVTDANGLSYTQAFTISITNVGGVGGTEGTSEEDRLIGTSGSDTLNGYDGNDTLQGGAGNDLLYGDAGNDSLDGGTGNDTLIGGAGNDVYLVDSAGDFIIEGVGEGTDTVRTTLALYTLADNIENLVYTGVATKAFYGVGNSSNNVITGAKGNDTLVGLDGNDTLNGGAGNDCLVGGTGNDYLDGGTGDDIYVVNAGDGNDTLVIDSANDQIIGTLDATDVVIIKTLDFHGDTGLAKIVYNLVGGAGNDTFVGGVLNDVLNGGTGADSFAGGKGDDVYVVDDAGDQIIENLNEGTDTVQASISYVLGDNLENLTLTGTLDLTGTGNALGNVINGNSGNNTIDGGDGNDRLNGGAGNDSLVGGAGDDALDGGVGADTMAGGDGVDSFVIDNIGDRIVDLAAGETVTLKIGNYDLSLLRGARIVYNLVGQAGPESLSGGIYNDTLDGGFGRDTLAGGTGNDIYYVDDASDVVIENVDEGTDTIYASIDYSLGDNVENLTLTGTVAINGTGNALNNIISGNGNNNRLDGADGNDTVIGNLGDDTLLGGNGNDLLRGGGGNDVLDGGNGTDTVSYSSDPQSDPNARFSGVIVNLGTDQTLNGFVYRGGTAIDSFGNRDTLTNIENVVGTNFDDAIFGSAVDNSLAGWNGNDYLFGGAGNDSLDGGSGSDGAVYQGSYGDYSVAWNADLKRWTVTDLSNRSGIYNDGSDTLAGIDYLKFLSDQRTIWLINTTLSGDDANNWIDGGIKNDSLTGGAGDDTLDGLAGNDTIDGGDGIDCAIYQGSYSDYQISWNANHTMLTVRDKSGRVGMYNDGVDKLINVETLQFLGDHRIVGVAANNTLAGTSTDEIFTGGPGSDVFIFTAGSGHDTIANFNANADSDLSPVPTHDTIAISTSLFKSWYDLLSKTTQVGSDLVIAASPNDTLTLKNVALSEFTWDDVIFYKSKVP